MDGINVEKKALHALLVCVWLQSSQLQSSFPLQLQSSLGQAASCPAAFWVVRISCILGYVWVDIFVNCELLRVCTDTKNKQLFGKVVWLQLGQQQSSYPLRLQNSLSPPQLYAHAAARQPAAPQLFGLFVVLFCFGFRIFVDWAGKQSKAVEWAVAILAQDSSRVKVGDVFSERGSSDYIFLRRNRCPVLRPDGLVLTV